MKYIIILVAITCLSCKQHIKKEAQTEAIAQHTKVEPIASMKADTISFAKALAALPNRSLPFTDDTSFDSFIEAEDYKEVAVEAFQLKTLYPNFDADGYNYRAIAAYRIIFSSAFHSVVITVKKGDNEMESVLINYDLSGNIIAHEVISYDEIAEGQFRITANVTKNSIEKSHVSWATGEEQVTKQKLTIDADGKINKVLTDENLLKKVIQALGLTNKKIEKRFLEIKVMPNSPDETIMVIPELTYEAEDDDSFTLDLHIVIVNNKTANITHTYVDKGWTSDAIRLDSLLIDTVPYLLAENTRAFGIRINFLGMSRPSPYSNQVITLFVPTEGTLKMVLKPYDVMNYGGEWDMVCAGEFVQENRTLGMAKTNTKGYFDIRVTTITKTLNHALDAQGECITSESETVTTSMLKFDGELYQVVE
jgi:hypothetical protein|tara:strand:- start:100605 stop:101870 length:1266 start_codon:yes stop_codon:yes gene_type:complete